MQNRKWLILLCALVVVTMLTGNASASATMATASPPAVKTVTGTSDQGIVVLTGTVAVTLTDQADNDAGYADALVYVVTMNAHATLMANNAKTITMVATNLTTMPANMRFENGLAIVSNTNTNAATAGVPPMAAVKALMKTQGQNGVAREVTALRIKPHTLATLAAAV